VKKWRRIAWLRGETDLSTIFGCLRLHIYMYTYTLTIRRNNIDKEGKKNGKDKISEKVVVWGYILTGKNK